MGTPGEGSRPYEQRRREDGKKRLKAEMWKAESRNPKARAFHSALTYFCFLLAQFLLSSSRLRGFAVGLTRNCQHQRARKSKSLSVNMGTLGDGIRPTRGRCFGVSVFRCFAGRVPLPGGW